MMSRLIHIDDYPQLTLLAWNRAVRDIDEAEALALYEANWKFVDPDELEPHEQSLINRLVQKYGHDLLNV